MGKGKIASLTDKFDSKNIKKDVKLPLLKKIGQENPEAVNPSSIVNPVVNYYHSRIAKSLDLKENGYITALSRQHFIQTI